MAHVLQGRLRLPGQPPGEQLVHDDARAVEVAADVRRAAEVLRTGVGRLAHEGVAGGERRHPGHARDPVVAHLRGAVLGDQDVAEAEVTMDHVLAVRRFQPVRHAEHDLQHALGFEPPLGLEDVGQRLGDELHHLVGLAVELAVVEHVDDVRGEDDLGDRRLAREAQAIFLLLRQVRVDHLQRDGLALGRLAGVAGGGRAVDRAHAAGADLLLDAVRADRLRHGRHLSPL